MPGHRLPTRRGGAQGQSRSERRHAAPRVSRWRKEGRDWRALLDMALENKPVAPTPPEFLAELQLRVDSHHRSVAAALKLLRADFAAGKPIPGYGTWSEWWMRQHPTRKLPKVFPGVYPTGFHPRTLRRKPRSVEVSPNRPNTRDDGSEEAAPACFSAAGSAPGRERCGMTRSTITS